MILVSAKRAHGYLWLGGVWLICLCGAYVANLKAWAQGSRADILTVEERAWLTAHPVIRLAPDLHYEPIEYFDEQGRYQGLTADYVALLEQRLGLRFQIVQIPKERRDLKDPELIGADALAASAETAQRREYWRYTPPYLEFPAYVITRKEARDGLTLIDLSGTRVAVVADYALEEYLRTTFPQLILDRVPDTNTGLRKVSFGLVDAFVSDLPVATYWMEHEGITNLKLAGETGFVYRLGFSARKDWPELTGILDKGLATITPDERMGIYRKWVKMPTAVSTFSQRAGVALIGGFVVAGIGLLLVFGWNRSLAAQVKQRTAALQQELNERRQAEQKLRTSEERFSTFFRSSPNPLAITRYGDNELLDINDRWVALSGYTKEEMLEGKGREKAMWAEPNVRRNVAELVRQQKPIRDFEFSYLTKTGERRTALLSAETIRLKDELCTLWTVQDFTERKQAEEALQQSEALFRSLTESTSAWVFITQGVYVRYFNPAAEAGIGYSNKELVGREMWSVLHPEDHQLIKTRIQARLNNLPLAPSFELRFVTKAGEIRWLQVSTTAIEYQGGAAELSTAFDITERKRAEAALQQSEEMFRSLTESTSAWVFIVQDELICYVNAACEAGSGYAREELLGRYLWPLVPAEDRPIVQARIETRKQGLPLSPNYEVRVITKEGEARWLQISSKIIPYNNGIADLSTAFDITERKRAEEALQQSEEMFRSLSETTPAWVYIIQRNRICYVNSAGVAGTGDSFDELLQIDLKDLTHPEDWLAIQERQESRKKGKEQALIYEARAVTKSGDVRWVQVASNIIEYNGNPAEICTAIDISERKQAEQALQRSEALFRSLAETTTAWVFVVQNDIIRYTNLAAQVGTEYTPEELLGANIWSFVHPDDLETARTLQYNRELKSNLPVRYEHRAITKSGKVLWLEITTSPIPYQNGIAILSTAIDITERKLAEQALQQSEALFRSLTETTPSWVYLVQGGRFAYANPSVEADTGYTRAELAQMEPTAIMLPEDHEWMRQRIQERREGKTIAPNFEMRYVSKSGDVRWIQVAAKLIEYNNTRAVLGTAFDITDRKQADEQLKISEQQLHQLAGYLQTVREEERTAIAREIHDELGQSLTAMKMDMVWLNTQQPTAAPPVLERTTRMIDLANSTINTVRKLATQLRPGILDDLGLTAALEWQASEFQSRTGIECTFLELNEIPELEPERATAIFRICQETLTNVARHAQATKVQIQLETKGHLLILQVCDNGRGVDETELAKRRSLGLLGMRERAFLLGGEFRLNSIPNNGTIVTAQIPLYQVKAKGSA